MQVGTCCPYTSVMSGVHMIPDIFAVCKGLWVLHSVYVPINVMLPLPTLLADSMQAGIQEKLLL